MKTRRRFAPLTHALLLASALLPPGVRAETGADAWLRYAPLEGEALAKGRAALPAVLTVAGDSPLVLSARDEILRGVSGMLGRHLRVETAPGREPGILIGTFADLKIQEQAPAESYVLRTLTRGGVRRT